MENNFVELKETIKEIEKYVNLVTEVTSLLNEVEFILEETDDIITLKIKDLDEDRILCGMVLYNSFNLKESIKDVDYFKIIDFIIYYLENTKLKVLEENFTKLINKQKRLIYSLENKEVDFIEVKNKIENVLKEMNNINLKIEEIENLIGTLEDIIECK